MMTSALLRHGPQHLGIVMSDLEAWLVDHEYVSTRQLQGSVSYASSDRPAAFERANYMRALHSWITPADLVPSVPSSPGGELAV
jgi:dihydroorotate dehydrogenase (fumarate)